MNIPYISRSKFLATCEEVITAQRDQLHSGVEVALVPGGYSGRVSATIRLENPTKFETDWEASDPTRFPARIKAAITALRNCGCSGTFAIVHRNGGLSIKRMP